MDVQPAVRPGASVAEARRMFRDHPVCHLGTVDGDGSPHVVPLWFVWLGDALYATSREGSLVVANLRRDPRVAVAIDRGRAWMEHVGVVVRGQADLLVPEDPAAKQALSAWFVKYRDELSGRGFAAYTEQVERPVIIRIRPARVSGWGNTAGGRRGVGRDGRGERRGARRLDGAG